MVKRKAGAENKNLSLPAQEPYPPLADKNISLRSRTLSPRKLGDKIGQTRPPIVVVLGHIDHGKTTLLDQIRKSSVAREEAGGITQRIGAYQVDFDERKITFIDTPGHEAFSKMRERGAQVADIAVLVVAADDGVKPQTVEAIAHARAAKIPIIVALNKIDLAKEEAVLRVKGQLAKENLVAEDQGGDTPVIPVSAKTGQGVSELLEMILLVADLAELKAEPESNLEAVVIESSLSSREGSLATVIVRQGTLLVGAPIFAGRITGRVKALVSDRGERVSSAGPGTPVSVLGFSAPPPVGSVVGREDEQTEKRADERVSQATPFPNRLTIQSSANLNVILRAETQGSLEAISAVLSELSVGEKKINLLLAGVGPVGDSDIRLAASANGVVLGFNVAISSSAQKLADDFSVGVRSFGVIYELLETAEKLLAGARALEEEEKEPEAEVIALFSLHSGDLVAGVKVVNGKIKYRDRVRVLRMGEEIGQSRVRGLKIGSNEVSQVTKDQEAGVLLKPKVELKKGDRIMVSSVSESRSKKE